MFRIKICGVTSAIDARGAAAAGADAIGLNFYIHSRRHLIPSAAVEVAAAIPPGVLKVGVFVNTPAELVCRIVDHVGLDLIQLAGDETPQQIHELGDRPVMKALRPRLDSAAEFHSMVVGFLDETDRLGCTPRLLMIDAHQPGAFGGTGKTIDWPLLFQLWNDLGRPTPPLVLAGGLNLENVQRAVETVHPAAVDVASGVESSPGVKDPEKMRTFVAAALAGLGLDFSFPVKPQASTLKPPSP
jgi:phosphoribosylanthranilate isomerase